MREVDAAIYREKLNGTRIPTTHGNSEVPTEMDLLSPQAVRRSVKNLQWVVDGMLGKSVSETLAFDKVKLDTGHLKTAMKWVLVFCFCQAISTIIGGTGLMVVITYLRAH